MKMKQCDSCKVVSALIPTYTELFKGGSKTVNECELCQNERMIHIPDGATIDILTISTITMTEYIYPLTQVNNWKLELLA